MLLYHFTTVLYLRPNRTPGEVKVAELPPLSRGDDQGLAALKGGPLVWLTADATSAIPAQGNCVRIGIMLPRSDRKLQQWVPYAKKAYGSKFVDIIDQSAQTLGLSGAETNRRLSHWWFYRGEIPS